MIQHALVGCLLNVIMDKRASSNPRIAWVKDKLGFSRQPITDGKSSHPVAHKQEYGSESV